MRTLEHLRTLVDKWWLLVTAWAAALTGILWWLIWTPGPQLRDQLRTSQFWALEAQFYSLLFLSVMNLPRLWRSLGLRWRNAIFPGVASLLAFLVVTLIAPKTNRIYYDEQIYESIAQNLTDLRLAQMCNDGNVEYGALQCLRGEYNKEPYGYPYVLSIAYRLLGVREGIPFALNAISAAIIVWVVFLATTALTGSAKAGGYAGLISALIPEQLRWSHSAAAEPFATLACAFAVLTALAFVRLRSTSALAWALVATVFAAQFRPECILVALVVLAIVLPHATNQLRQTRVWWAALLTFLSSAIYIGHLLAVRTEGWGASGPRFSAAFLAANFHSNCWFYLGDQRFPVLYTALALAGLVLWRRAWEVTVLLVYFLLFWGVFLFFYAGSYNYGADDRFSLMTYPPIAIMAGIGVWRLLGALSEVGWVPSVRSPFLGAAVLGLQFCWYLPFVRTVGEEAWGARADVAFARSMAADLPRNSFMLTQNPNMFHIWGQSAAQASIATTEAGYVDNVLRPRYAGGVFFHWNFWCNVSDPLQRSFCVEMLKSFPHTLIREYRERDYRYALYRLEIVERPTDPQK